MSMKTVGLLIAWSLITTVATAKTMNGFKISDPLVPARLIQGGGVRVNGERIADVQATLPVGTHDLQSGKRKFARVVVG